MSTATEMRDKYLTAEMAILEGKEVRLGDRTLRMEDLNMVQAGRREWEERVAGEQRATAGRRTLGGLSVAVADFSGRN